MIAAELVEQRQNGGGQTAADTDEFGRSVAEFRQNDGRNCFGMSNVQPTVRDGASKEPTY